MSNNFGNWWNSRFKVEGAQKLHQSQPYPENLGKPRKCPSAEPVDFLQLWEHVFSLFTQKVSQTLVKMETRMFGLLNTGHGLQRFKP